MRKPSIGKSSPRPGVKKSGPARPATRPRRDGLADGKEMSQGEIWKLRTVAGRNPTLLFGIYQLAAIMGLHPDNISQVAAHPEAPAFLRTFKRGRPEWVLAFLQNPPHDFIAGK